MQGRTLRRQARPRGPAISHRSRCRRAPARARGGGAGNGGDDGGGGAGPLLRDATIQKHDKALELKLIVAVALAITETTTVDDKIPEIVSALIAALGYFIARSGAGSPSLLPHALHAVTLLLTKHIASALRLAARANADDKRGERP